MMTERCNFAKNNALDMEPKNSILIPNPSNELVAFIEKTKRQNTE